jgi:hypothetical protein
LKTNFANKSETRKEKIGKKNFAKSMNEGMIQELQEDGLGDHFHADELRSEVDADVRSRMSSLIQSNANIILLGATHSPVRVEFLNSYLDHGIHVYLVTMKFTYNIIIPIINLESDSD